MFLSLSDCTNTDYYEHRPQFYAKRRESIAQSLYLFPEQLNVPHPIFLKAPNQQH
jgi:hypothetical protein